MSSVMAVQSKKGKTYLFDVFENMENYLDSLSLYIVHLDLSEMNIHYLPSLKRFTNLRHLDCSRNNLVSLPEFNKNLERVICSYNKLASLPKLNTKLQILHCNYNDLASLPALNENLEHLMCNHNRLTCLPPLNENLNVLYCQFNQLTSLPLLNKSLNRLVCFNNRLTCLPPLNHNLTTLDCDFNELTYLPPLNKKLEVLQCSNNNLYCFPDLNDNLGWLRCTDNPNIEFIDTKKNEFLEIKANISKLNRFRHVYYCLRFKRQFKDWLWLRVREPKIKEHFHPMHLENLDEDAAELDNFLNHW